MKYKIYRLSFTTAVHFGSGALASTEITFCADTLFSALCIESLGSKYSPARLADDAQKGKLLFSDALPYSGDTLFLPRPLMALKNIVSDDKKLMKKLHYLPLNAFSSDAFNPSDAVRMIEKLGTLKIRERAFVRREEDSLPYSVASFEYAKGNGVYIIFGFNDDETEKMIDTLFASLALRGIGGKTSSGLGRFTIESCPLPRELEKMLSSDKSISMSLSCAMARDAELESTLDGASYLLIKRSGFIASQTYAKTLHKKRDMFVFKSGSCFKNAFEGDVFDVSQGGAHPVYRYAKPMLVGVI